MALDNAKNGARATLASGIAAGATSIALTSGHGARMPDVPFNAWIYNATDFASDPHDDPGYEIVRVTARSTDTLTVTRAQERTTAADHNTSGKTYRLVAGETARIISDEMRPFIGQHTYTVASFGASGSAVTTTGSIIATSNTLTVASASSFATGQGIYIAGAGAAGVPLIATITAISGTTITLGTNASTTVSSVLVQHDDTTAIQNALNLLSTIHALTLIFDNGFYRINGPINTTSNSILTIPYDGVYLNGTPRYLRMYGQYTPVGDVLWVPSTRGTIIQTDKVGTDSNTSMLNARSPYLGNSLSDMLPLANLVTVEIANMTFRTYDNPNISGIDMWMAWNTFLRNVMVDTGMPPEGIDFSDTGVGSEPTHNTFAIRLPRISTIVQTNNVHAVCFGVGIIYSDLWESISTMVIRCKIGIYTRGHDYPITGTILIVQCPTGIYIEGSVGLGIPGMDCHVRWEHDGRTLGHWWEPIANRYIYDPTNVFFGQLKYFVVHGFTGGIGFPITVTGCTGLTKTNLKP